MSVKTIRGKIVYQNLGPGFWGIVEGDGTKWRPVNLPDHFKEEGKHVLVRARELDDDISVFMWGRPIEIV